MRSNTEPREDVTRLAGHASDHVCPRVNPDGAEWALADRPYIRSSTRPYPYDEEAMDGLDVEDVDGDWRILMMRIADPMEATRRTRPRHAS